MTSKQRGFFDRWVGLLRAHAHEQVKCGGKHELHPTLHAIAWEIQAFAAAMDAEEEVPALRPDSDEEIAKRLRGLHEALKRAGLSNTSH